MGETLEINGLVHQARLDGRTGFIARVVLIAPEARVLLLKRSKAEELPGYFEIPGGEVEHHEDLITALIREVKEETGIVLNAQPNFVSYFDFVSSRPTETIFYREFIFAINVASVCSVSISSEHESALWVTEAELSKLQMFDDVRTAVISSLQV